MKAIVEMLKKIILVYFIVLIPIWFVFAINEFFFFGSLNSFGVVPRDFSFTAFVGVLVSWLLHADLAHIKGNSFILFQSLVILALIEKKPLLLIFSLIAGSGFATWLLGSSGSVHVGASGLVFAIFGYVLGAVLFGRKLLYLVVLALVGAEYWFTFKQGLIPQAGVSFAGHFGGLVAGLFLGYLFGYSEPKNSYKKPLKQKWADFLWEIKYKIKQFKFFSN